MGKSLINKLDIYENIRTKLPQELIEIIKGYRLDIVISEKKRLFYKIHIQLTKRENFLWYTPESPAFLYDDIDYINAIRLPKLVPINQPINQSFDIPLNIPYNYYVNFLILDTDYNSDDDIIMSYIN
tara:strand:- start:396 stop:776 length:381 start_codon:yes stop_codon:yes gene_type:complete